MAELPYRQNGSVIARRAVDKTYLLVRKPRVRHAWQWPQGGVEKGETAYEAAVREFEEEIGTDTIKIIGTERGTFRYDFPPDSELPDYLKDRTDRYRGQEVHLFLADFLGTDADIHLESAELAEYRWVTADELPTLLEDQDYLRTSLTIIHDSRETH